MTFNDIMDALREMRNVTPLFYRNRPNILSHSAYGSMSDPNADDIKTWSKNIDVPVEDLLNDIAIETSKDFLKNRIGYETADWIANRVLFVGLSDFHLELPQDNLPDWWAVYLAFDESEAADDCEARARQNLEAYFGELMPRLRET